MPLVHRSSHRAGRPFCLVFVLLLWLGAAPASGQFLVPPCQIEIEAAHDAYLNQAY